MIVIFSDLYRALSLFIRITTIPFSIAFPYSLKKITLPPFL